MRIVLTGGCTGGHIYPALAIGEKFKSANKDNEIIYIGHEFGLETSIVPNAGFDLKIITADWIRRDNPLRMIKTLRNTKKGKNEAVEILKKFKPDVVISTGSFVSVPVVMAASKLHIPIFIQEQNGFPGVSNRTFAKKARKIFLGFESARKYFKIKDENIIYSGNPVRKDFYNRNSNEDKKKMGYENNDMVITVFGGSLGSDMTNKIGIKLIEKYKDNANVKILFGTGVDYYERVLSELDERNLIEAENAKVKPYISNMPECFSASDLIISRSGALTVAEVTMAGRAAIFIPSPNVTADHQYFNAKAVEDNGGAIIIRENNDTMNKLLCKMDELLNEPSEIKNMGDKSFELAPIHSLDIIYKTVVGELGIIR